MADFPDYVCQAAASGALIGDLLDMLQTQHNRQERETREARGNTPWPPFDRAGVRVALLGRFPPLAASHPKNRMNVQARQRASAMFDGYYRELEA